MFEKMNVFTLDNLGVITSILSFFGFGFLSLSDRLKIYHQNTDRAVEIEDEINQAMFKFAACKTAKECKIIATRLASPASNKLVRYYKAGMLNKSIALVLINTIYESLLIETSYLAVNESFNFYNIQDWLNIKQKTKQEQKILRKQKDNFLKITFPDFYDIHYSLKNNPVSYIFKALHFIFHDCPTWLIEKPLMPIWIKNLWIWTKELSKCFKKWFKSFFYINNLSDVFTMFVVPLVPPFFISLGVYVLFLYLKV